MTASLMSEELVVLENGATDYKYSQWKKTRQVELPATTTMTNFHVWLGIAVNDLVEKHDIKHYRDLANLCPPWKFFKRPVEATLKAMHDNTKSPFDVVRPLMEACDWDALEEWRMTRDYVHDAFKDAANFGWEDIREFQDEFVGPGMDPTEFNQVFSEWYKYNFGEGFTAHQSAMRYIALKGGLVKQQIPALWLMAAPFQFDIIYQLKPGKDYHQPIGWGLEDAMLNNDDVIRAEIVDETINQELIEHAIELHGDHLPDWVAHYDTMVCMTCGNPARPDELNYL